MKRTVLLLLACLLLAVRTVAQAPEKAAPDDLVVTAEIVGSRYHTAANMRDQSYMEWSVKASILNKTQLPRIVTVMSCGWDDSWVSNGDYVFCGWGCDKNTPVSITIPAGQALIFCGDLCKRQNARSNNPENLGFKLGFLDVAEADFPALLLEGGASKKPDIYWSNELLLSDYRTFHLSNSEK